MTRSLLDKQFTPNRFCEDPAVQSELIRRGSLELAEFFEYNWTKPPVPIKTNDGYELPGMNPDTSFALDRALLTARALGEIRVGEGTEEADSELAYIYAVHALIPEVARREHDRTIKQMTRLLLFSLAEKRLPDHRLDYHVLQHRHIVDKRPPTQRQMFDFPFARDVASDLVAVKARF